MLKNCNATVFVRSSDGFVSYQFENAFVYEEKKINFEENGRVCIDKAVLRVFTKDELPVKCGDYATFYLSDDNTPPKNCYTVTEVCDNRHAIAGHYRITVAK